MVVNEDYFKDIDISDDDIDIESSNEPCDGVPCSVGDINDDALRRYSHTIKIGFYRNRFININGDDDFPHTEMQNLAMHISYLLDNYGIGHSPVYVLYQNEYYNPKWVIYNSENDAEENLKITDRGSYVQLETPYEREKPLETTDIYIYTDDLRKFRTVKSAITFIKRLGQTVFLHGNISTMDVMLYQRIEKMWSADLSFKYGTLSFDRRKFRNIVPAYVSWHIEDYSQQFFFTYNMIKWFFNMSTAEEFRRVYLSDNDECFNIGVVDDEIK